MLVFAALRGRDHETAVLDRACAHQHMPVCLAGLARERGRDRQEGRAGFGERTIERREAQVVADRHPEPAPWQVGDNRKVALTIAVRLAIALAALQVDVEHVDLVVARRELAFAVDQEAAVRGFLGPGLDGERADMDVNAKRTRKLAECCKRGVVLFRYDLGEQAFARTLEDVGHLGRLYVFGAALLRFADQFHGRVEVGSRRAPGAHLNETDAEGRTAVHLNALYAASNASSLPASSSA